MEGVAAKPAEETAAPSVEAERSEPAAAPELPLAAEIPSEAVPTWAAEAEEPVEIPAGPSVEPRETVEEFEQEASAPAESVVSVEPAEELGEFQVGVRDLMRLGWPDRPGAEEVEAAPEPSLQGPEADHLPEPSDEDVVLGDEIVFEARPATAGAPLESSGEPSSETAAEPGPEPASQLPAVAAEPEIAPEPEQAPPGERRAKAFWRRTSREVREETLEAEPEAAKAPQGPEADAAPYPAGRPAEPPTPAPEPRPDPSVDRRPARPWVPKPRGRQDPASPAEPGKAARPAAVAPTGPAAISPAPRAVEAGVEPIQPARSSALIPGALKGPQAPAPPAPPRPTAQERPRAPQQPVAARGEPPAPRTRPPAARGEPPAQPPAARAEPLAAPALTPPVPSAEPGIRFQEFLPEETGPPEPVPSPPEKPTPEPQRAQPPKRGKISKLLGRSAKARDREGVERSSPPVPQPQVPPSPRPVEQSFGDGVLERMARDIDDRSSQPMSPAASAPRPEGEPQRPQPEPWPEAPAASSVSFVPPPDAGRAGEQAPPNEVVVATVTMPVELESRCPRCGDPSPRGLCEDCEYALLELRELMMGLQD